MCELDLFFNSLRRMLLPSGLDSITKNLRWPLCLERPPDLYCKSYGCLQPLIQGIGPFWHDIVRNFVPSWGLVVNDWFAPV
jgi:hypothetical protein